MSDQKSNSSRLALSVAIAFWVATLVLTIGTGFSDSFLVRFVQIVALALGAAAVLLIILPVVIIRMAHYKDPRDEGEFELLVRTSEQLASDDLAVEPDEHEFLELDPFDRHDFERLVREALDDLPDLLIKALNHVPVIISNKGRKHKAYGLYQGDGVSRDNYPDRIVIFRDTLLRDFGHDPDLLRDQVTRVVRHELAHHLGADELGVREMGL